MRQINNDLTTARQLFNAIIQTGVTPIFDLDEVLLCAKHRQKLYSLADVQSGACSADRVGQLDLEHYRTHSKPELVSKDKNLPLLQCIRLLNEYGKPYHVATARVACAHTQRLLKDRGIRPVLLMAREGEQDNRRDHVLKVERIREYFKPLEWHNLLMIDDNLANCKALEHLGLQVMQVTNNGR